MYFTSKLEKAVHFPKRARMALYRRIGASNWHGGANLALAVGDPCQDKESSTCGGNPFIFADRVPTATLLPMKSPFLPLVFGVFLVVADSGSLHSEESADRVAVTLASTPALSPDGGRLAFSWAGDLWIAKARGGAARRLTTHAAYEGDPAFSPDGTRLAFTSNRSGKDQVYVMPAEGGLPRQLTFHSEGARVVEWYPDGASLLVEATRDFATRRATRLYRISSEGRGPEVLLFDAEGHSPALSPDGKRLLFCREGSDLYRRGYRGSQASQIWLAEDLETPAPKFRQLVARESEARSPMWRPDGEGFYYLGDHGESALFDLWERELGSGEERRLTTLADDPAIGPAIARDGSAVVFRQRFEFRRLALAGKDAGRGPRPVRLEAAADTLPDPEVRRVLTKADNVSFSADGLEMAFAAGGDIWVMDSELREPVPVTRTAAEEREPIFSADGSTLYFIRDEGDSVDLWSVSRADAKAYWWRNRQFEETRLTKDGLPKEDLRAVPGGTRLCWIAGGGNLWVAERDGKEARRLVESWNAPHYDWSPDGRWIAYAVYDNDFNRDVWIAPADGSAPAYNLSRHPDNDGHPSWSPDGRMLAFVGRRYEKESDIYYVHLSLADEEKDKRDRTLEGALKKMDAARKKPEPAAPPKPAAPPADPGKADPPKADPPKTETETDPAPDPKPGDPKPGDPKAGDPKAASPSAAPAAGPARPEVKIDFDRLSERIRRVAIPDTTESGLFWSPDSKRLAFAATVKGVRGTYTVSFPDPGTPALLSAKTGGLARWTAKDETVLWLVEGLPASLSKGVLRTYPFTARQAYPLADYQRVAFRQIWRTMRDTWYDEALNHRDWDAVRAKYEDAAATATDNRAFDRVVAMMLGELNGSHLGFRSSQDRFANRSGQGWSEETAHLGLVFDRFFGGPGWKVASVVPRGPADRGESRLRPGDILLEIDGRSLEPGTDPSLVLNGPPGRELQLKVSREREAVEEEEKADDGEEEATEPAVEGPAEPATPSTEAGGGEEDLGEAKEPETKEPEAAPAEKPAAPPEPEILELSLRPIDYARARELMKEVRVEARRELVDRLSGGRVGYVLVEKMDWNEFIRFQEEIFARGHGKDGLLVDVRDNGGGFTADHLLTMLTPAEHAITVPRGGGPGYPQDRRVYPTWNRPVTVLCNQNSFSNAEIFSHAIKEIGRGKLVGVPTAGGVVSTGSTDIRDLGTLRVPFRGWYRRSDGADMELNGAVPDLLVWPEPGDEAEGRDRQLERAVEALLRDLEAEKAKPQPELKPASSLAK
jgi:tricorn protease